MNDKLRRGQAYLDMNDKLMEIKLALFNAIERRLTVPEKKLLLDAINEIHELGWQQGIQEVKKRN